MTRPATTLVVGTRTSRLARWQTDWVLERLSASGAPVRFDVRPFVTTGDAVQDTPLPQIGRRGVFTTELEQALRSGEIDLAVHSLKDLPTEEMPGLAIGAVPVRADARDVLVTRQGGGLASLPEGARVGTSSLRRTAQLRALRPDLDVQPIRGNVDTRVRKVQDGQYDAAVLAAAGLLRLGLDAYAGERFALDMMVPAPGQAALAVQCRAEDAATRVLLAAINDPQAEAATRAERTFLHTLGGGCSVPVAAYAAPGLPGQGLRLVGLVLSVDGTRRIRVEGHGEDAALLGADLARRALERGAAALLHHER